MKQGTRLARESAPHGNQLIWISAGICLLSALLLYAPVLRASFTNWDDPKLVTDNPAIRSLAPANLAEIFTPVPGQTYQPLRVLSYAIDYALWNLSPGGYHTVNVILHGLASWLLFLVLFRLHPLLRLQASRPGVFAGLVAGLFLVHPINVESVAWVSSRKYVLLACFAFLSLLCYLLWLQQQRPWQRGLMYLAILAAALSSPFGVALAPAILLLDFCRRTGTLQRDLRDLVSQRWPLLVFALLLGTFFIWVLTSGDPGQETPHKSHYEVIPILKSIQKVPATYIGMLLYPVNLNVRYPFTIESGWPIAVWGWALFNLAVVAAVGSSLRRSRVVLLAVGWSLLWWAPVSNLIPTSTRVADRYMYLPGIGLFSLLIGALLHWLHGRPKARRYAPVFGTLCAVLLIGLSIQRARAWRSSLTLWSDSVAKNPQNFLAQGNLALAYLESGDRASAIRCFQAALELESEHPYLHNNLGYALVDEGRLEEAYTHFAHALRLKPTYKAAILNQLDLLVKLHRHDQAMPLLNSYRQIAPEDAAPLRRHCEARMAAAQFAKAYAAYEHLLTHQARTERDWANAAYCLHQLRRHAEAHAHLQQAVMLAPDNLLLQQKLKLSKELLSKHRR